MWGNEDRGLIKKTNDKGSVRDVKERRDKIECDKTGELYNKTEKD